jgi:hypothetical protein
LIAPVLLVCLPKQGWRRVLVSRRISHTLAKFCFATFARLGASKVEKATIWASKGIHLLCLCEMKEEVKQKPKSRSAANGVG